MYKKINQCRLCGNNKIKHLFSLGEQYLTGVFLNEVDQNITKGPLSLVKCYGDDSVCGLVQLEHTFDSKDMFSEGYGYRSALNITMVNHLHSNIKNLLRHISLVSGDIVIDIGSNDGTTLKGYDNKNIIKVGYDIAGENYKDYYPSDFILINESFNTNSFKSLFKNKKIKIVTAIAMFYDLNDPLHFITELSSNLEDDGVIMLEMSYLYHMINNTSYDTICHEHVGYYSLTQMNWIAVKAKLTIIEFGYNTINGGSFYIIFKKQKPCNIQSRFLNVEIEKEKLYECENFNIYDKFFNNINSRKFELITLVNELISKGKKIGALGASTKGNVILQFCELTNASIFCIGEINKEKVGKITPGTKIPIIEESTLLCSDIDYLIILPWHFSEFFKNNKKFKNKKLIFPLPLVHVFNT